MTELELDLPDEARTQALGTRLAALVEPPAVIYLSGDLGAGKTTLVRGYLRGLGHTGKVKSPTYTLIEPYEIGGRGVHHLDLYRLADPGELEFLGIRDLFEAGAVSLIEWPERGAGCLPPADLHLVISHRDRGRQVRLKAGSAVGRRVLAGLAETGIGI